MKTIFKLFAIILFTVGLTACGNPPDIEDRTDTEMAEEQTSYTGVIEAFELDIYQDGTHQIKTDSETIVIQSPTINLNNYLDQKVTITGSVQKLIDNKSEVFTVSTVERENGGADGEYLDYEAKVSGFKFSYPGNWDLVEDIGLVTLKSGGKDIVTITVYTTEDDLDEFVSSHETEEGTPITIGAQRSLRYTAQDAISIYTPNPSKGKVYHIFFDATAEGSDSLKPLFYDFLESFFPIITQVKSGEKCGGTKNLTCPEGFRCELESVQRYSEGVCISVDEEESDLSCPFVSTPPGCTNYEPKSFNKDNCPTSYECLDEPELEEEATSDSEELKPVAAEPAEAGEGMDETSSKDPVSAFVRHQDAILPVGAEVIQFELAEEQSLLAVIFTVDDQDFRRLYSFTPSADEYNFEKLAHFEEGEDRDWVLVEGEEISIKSDKKIIKAGEDEDSIQVIRDDMRLYENPHKNYSIQYPKNWYYRSFGSIENTVWTVGFAEESLDDASDASISLVILDGYSRGKAEMKADQYFVEVGRDEDSHFLLDGPLEMKEELDFMASSIIQQ